MKKITDSGLLRVLLGSKRLSSSQEKAFRQMLQDLADGRLIGLTKSQRLWAEQVFDGFNFAPNKLPAPVAMPKPRKQFDAPPTVFDAPKPLKPPGKS